MAYVESLVIQPAFIGCPKQKTKEITAPINALAVLNPVPDPKHRCVEIQRPKTPPAKRKTKRPNREIPFHTRNALKEDREGKKMERK